MRDDDRLDVWQIVVFDVLFFGISLVTFAYFHHVRPRVPDTPIIPITVLDPTTSGDTTSQFGFPVSSSFGFPVATETPAPSETPSETPSDTPMPTDTPVSTETPTETPTPTEPPTPTPTPAPTPTPVPTPTPEPDYSFLGLGAKFHDKFNSDGSVTVASDRYVSGKLAVYLTTTVYEGSTCRVADVYLCNIADFRTVLAKDKYGYNVGNESVEKMAKRTSAVLAANGDYYGWHADAFMVRNGLLYNAEKPTSDMCVLYSNGVLKSYYAADFNGDEAIKNGAWQSWCFGPKLLENGKALTKFNTKVSVANPRTVLGYYEPGHYCVITVDGRQDASPGLTMKQLSKFCESLGLSDAYNLDGGATSAMCLNGTVVNSRSGDTSRMCSDAIIFVDN